MSTFRSIKIKKTRKVHDCAACEWLMGYGFTSEEIFNEIDFTEDEKQAILKAEANGWKIPKGDSCTYFVGIFDGDFCDGYCIDEIHDICVKYDIYQD